MALDAGGSGGSTNPKDPMMKDLFNTTLDDKKKKREEEDKDKPTVTYKGNLVRGASNSGLSASYTKGDR